MSFVFKRQNVQEKLCNRPRINFKNTQVQLCQQKLSVNSQSTEVKYYIKMQIKN